jgi:hypothetical protein
VGTLNLSKNVEHMSIRTPSCPFESILLTHAMETPNGASNAERRASREAPAAAAMVGDDIPVRCAGAHVFFILSYRIGPTGKGYPL